MKTNFLLHKLNGLFLKLFLLTLLSGCGLSEGIKNLTSFLLFGDDKVSQANTNKLLGGGDINLLNPGGTPTPTPTGTPGGLQGSIVSSLYPVNGATDVSLTTQVGIQFYPNVVYGQQDIKDNFLLFQYNAASASYLRIPLTIVENNVQNAIGYLGIPQQVLANGQDHILLIDTMKRGSIFQAYIVNNSISYNNLQTVMTQSGVIVSRFKTTSQLGPVVNVTPTPIASPTPTPTGTPGNGNPQNLSVNLIDTYPENNDVNIPVTADIVLTFQNAVTNDELALLQTNAVLVLTSDYQAMLANSRIDTSKIIPVALSQSALDANKIIMNPNNSLTVSTNYTFIVDNSLSSFNPASIASFQVRSFTTASGGVIGGDNGLSITATVPTQKASNINYLSSALIFSLQFNRTLTTPEKGQISSMANLALLKKDDYLSLVQKSNAGTLVANDVMGALVLLKNFQFAQQTLVDDTVTFDANADLLPSTSYILVFNSKLDGLLKAKAGSNTLQTISSTDTVEFSTSVGNDPGPVDNSLRIISTEPAQGYNGKINRQDSLYAVFNRALTADEFSKLPSSTAVMYSNDYSQLNYLMLNYFANPTNFSDANKLQVLNLSRLMFDVVPVRDPNNSARVQFLPIDEGYGSYYQIQSYTLMVNLSLDGIKSKFTSQQALTSSINFYTLDFSANITNMVLPCPEMAKETQPRMFLQAKSDGIYGPFSVTNGVLTNCTQANPYCQKAPMNSTVKILDGRCCYVKIINSVPIGAQGQLFSLVQDDRAILSCQQAQYIYQNFNQLFSGLLGGN
jgi:hypothetical protein